MLKKTDMVTGVYCGSFNPVHKGHIRIVRKILKQKLADRVLIIPTGNYWYKQDLMDVNARIEMLKVYENENIIIDSVHNGIEYTYELFEKLKEEDPNQEYRLILGADNLVNFRKWQHYEDLLKYGFIIVPRDNLRKREIRKMMKDFNKENYEILDTRNIDISSTYIREHLDDYSLIRNCIDRKVYDILISRDQGTI